VRKRTVTGTRTKKKMGETLRRKLASQSAKNVRFRPKSCSVFNIRSPLNVMYTNRLTMACTEHISNHQITRKDMSKRLSRNRRDTRLLLANTRTLVYGRCDLFSFLDRYRSNEKQTTSVRITSKRFQKRPSARQS